MAAHLTDEAEIRKLRKKLRQIENLERLTRPLDELELVKVEKKYDIRERLQDLLDRVDSSEAEPDSRDTSSTVPQSSTQLGREAVEEGDALPQDGENEWRMGVEEEVGSSGAVSGVFSGFVGGEKMNEKGDGVKGSVPVVESGESAKAQFMSDRAAERTSKKGRKAERSRSNQWDQVSVVVSELEGHNDLVTSIAVQGSRLVSASRDTTVKVWDLETGEETCSFGGHTETVTSVLILSPEETALLSAEDGSPGEDSYIVSGSTDCTFKVWSSKSGKLVKSVYTFNPVTCLDYSYTAHLLVTTTDGGKVELWDVKTAKNVFSTRAHEDCVTGVKVLKSTVISSDAEGLVMVHEIRDGDSLVRVFVSEDVKCSGTRGQVHRRFVRSLAASDRLVVIGDDAVNLKLLDWKKGVVSKLVNHVSEFSSTDALCMWEDVLLSSSYDLDTGYGYINIRSLSSGEYLASLDDEVESGTERIVCLAATRVRSGDRILLSGGAQLKMWRLLPLGHSVPRESDEDKWVTVTQFLPALAKPARDSEPESDLEEEDDTDDDDDDDGKGDGKRRKRCEEDDGETGGGGGSWMSWCSIL